MQREPEKTLIEKIKSGDLKAFNELIELNKNQVFQFCVGLLKNREESEEVAQDVFVKAYNGIKKFKGQSKFTTWLYRITYNECISRLRKNKKWLKQVDLDEVDYQIADIEKGYESLENEEKSKMIERSLNELDHENKTIVLMFYFHEKKVEEIAEIMSLTKTNVKTKLFRTRKKLLHIMKGKLKMGAKELL